MDLIKIYQCLCDETRLRIVHLLTHGPLCVCHLQTILEASQTRVSQHLSYLRARGLVEASRKGSRMSYSLPERMSQELEAHLKCLGDCVQSERMFAEDLFRRHRLEEDAEQPANAEPACAC